jgi:hypothetical protein
MSNFGIGYAEAELRDPYEPWEEPVFTRCPVCEQMEFDGYECLACGSTEKIDCYHQEPVLPLWGNRHE